MSFVSLVLYMSLCSSNKKIGAQHKDAAKLQKIFDTTI